MADIYCANMNTWYTVRARRSCQPCMDDKIRSVQQTHPAVDAPGGIVKGVRHTRAGEALKRRNTDLTPYAPRQLQYAKTSNFEARTTAASFLHADRTHAPAGVQTPPLWRRRVLSQGALTTPLWRRFKGKITEPFRARNFDPEGDIIKARHGKAT